VTRTRLPMSSAEPSRIASTLSSRAISGSALATPLYFIADVREITRSALRRASSEISASVMPSAKYSCAGSCETLSSGSTASERMASGSPGRACAPLSPACFSRRSSLHRSSAVWNRTRGAFSRQRPTMRSRSAGRSARTFASGAGVSRRMEELTSADDAPVKGLRPLASS